MRGSGLQHLFWAVSLVWSLVRAHAAIEWLPNSLHEVYRPQGDFYAYAPAVILDGKVERYWCCRNATPGVIRDHIYYLERVDGKITRCKVVLQPAPGATWDSFHVCDPSVVNGQFTSAGLTYKHALFYLGNNVDASANNQIGVAFSNDLAGEWTRLSQPLIPYPPQGHWGIGQPSAISLDGKGRFLVFYTKGGLGTTGCFREVTFPDSGPPELGPEKAVPLGGLVQADGRADFLNNFDVAYEPLRKRFFAVRERHPYPQTEPRIISSTLEVVSISAQDLRLPGGRWQTEAIIGPDLTGQGRNHNAGIERTGQGTLPDPNEIRVVFTSSCAETNCAGRNSLWTYALWEIRGRIRNIPAASPVPSAASRLQ